MGSIDETCKQQQRKKKMFLCGSHSLGFIHWISRPFLCLVTFWLLIKVYFFHFSSIWAIQFMSDSFLLAFHDKHKDIIKIRKTTRKLKGCRILVSLCTKLIFYSFSINSVAERVQTWGLFRWLCRSCLLDSLILYLRFVEVTIFSPTVRVSSLVADWRN